MGLCQILKRCILCIEGGQKTPPVAWEWNTPLKPPAQTPIFSVPTPPVDISRASSEFIYFCYDIVAKWNKKMLDTATELCYNSQRKIMKNLLKFIIMLLRKIEKILQKTGR